MATSNYSTLSRKKILDFLNSNCDRTVTVQDINHYLVENGYGVNISTIYRYLDKLVKDGSVMKYASEDGSSAVFQYVNPSSKCNEHLHLQCVKCGKVCHLEGDLMSDLSAEIRNNHKFSILCKNSIIYGICEACE